MDGATAKQAQSFEMITNLVSAAKDARSTSRDNFLDKAPTTVSKCRQALIFLKKERPALLDELEPAPAESKETLEMFVDIALQKKVLRGNVKECLFILLERPSWRHAAIQHVSFKTKLLNLLKEGPKSGQMDEIVGLLEAASGPMAPAPAESLVAKWSCVPIPSTAPAAPRDEASAKTVEMLQRGLQRMRENGYQSARSTDKAIEAFESFFQGISRIFKAFKPMETERFGKHTQHYEGVLESISSDIMPQILEFFVTIYNRRPLKRKALYVVDKFGLMCRRFQDAVDQRSTDDAPDRLPWLVPIVAVPNPSGAGASGPPAQLKKKKPLAIRILCFCSRD